MLVGISHGSNQRLSDRLRSDQRVGQMCFPRAVPEALSYRGDRIPRVLVLQKGNEIPFRLLMVDFCLHALYLGDGECFQSQLVPDQR